MASEIWKGRRFAAMGLWLLAAAVASANEAEVAEAKAPVEPPWRVETRHQGQFGGQTLRYTARVGEMRLLDAAGEPVAALCYTAYLVDSDRPRPVSGGRARRERQPFPTAPRGRPRRGRPDAVAPRSG